MPWYSEGVTMKEAAPREPAVCTRFHHASELIGRRWNGPIIYLLLQQTCRFATLRDGIPGITDRMLSERLQALEEEGLVSRTVRPDTPVRVEYALTKKGKTLADVFETISKWAEKHVPLPEDQPKARSRASR